jgi:predicted phosphodiesterase
MKVAVFADVHGNLIALERFLGATKNGVDEYLCLGDVVNYGPWNDECLEAILALPNVTLIEGNHERLFMGEEDVRGELPLVRDFFDHSIETFSSGNLISGLPRRTQLGGFECTHTIDGRSIYPDSEILIDRSFLIGHTHHQFRIDRSGFEVVNPGSVGQNRKWIDRVDYAVFDTSSGEIRMHSLPYDVDLFLSELRSRGYPQQCVDYYAGKPRKGA